MTNLSVNYVALLVGIWENPARRVRSRLNLGQTGRAEIRHNYDLRCLVIDTKSRYSHTNFVFVTLAI